MMKFTADIPDIQNKRVLLRADFDVPVGPDGVIRETFRILRQKPMLDWLREHGAQVTVISHISAVSSFEPLKEQIAALLGPLTLRENLRADAGEESNDPAFAATLVADHDLYINNAFAVCHREHASVSAITKLLPSYAGLLVGEEVTHLAAALTAPPEGKVVYIGGAKVSTKMPVIEHFLDKAEAIAVGGVIANELTASDARVHVATDFITDGGVALDIGPQSAAAFAELARTARMIIWNGPMGRFEDPRYMEGTKILAQAIAESAAEKIIGGGDTIAAVDQLGLLDRMGFVSTGGGAMLAFLAGQHLPGLQALGYYHD